MLLFCSLFYPLIFFVRCFCLVFILILCFTCFPQQQQKGLQFACDDNVMHRGSMNYAVFSRLCNIDVYEVI